MLVWSDNFALIATSLSTAIHLQAGDTPTQ